MAGRKPGYIGARVPFVRLTEMRDRINENFGKWGPYTMYHQFSVRGWIPVKNDGEHLDRSGFIRAYRMVAKDRQSGISDFAVRFLYRAAVAAGKHGRGKSYTVRDVKDMLGLHEATVKDVLLNYGDI